jgi:hypothetical protein
MGRHEAIGVILGVIVFIQGCTTTPQKIEPPVESLLGEQWQYLRPEYGATNIPGSDICIVYPWALECQKGKIHNF